MAHACEHAKAQEHCHGQPLCCCRRSTAKLAGQQNHPRGRAGVPSHAYLITHFKQPCVEGQHLVIRETAEAHKRAASLFTRGGEHIQRPQAYVVAEHWRKNIHSRAVEHE
jgi:hypothetical protein